MPESINITVKYDKTLQEITEMAEMPMIMSEGAPFVFLLDCIFMDYPEIQEKYPPGVLAFSVNGVAPKNNCQLHDEDEISFWVV